MNEMKSKKVWILFLVLVVSALPFTVSAAVNFGPSTSGVEVIGEWDVQSDTSATSSVGGGWNQIWMGDVSETNYTVKADVTWLETGTTAEYPKYGIFATYKDGDNFVTAFLDKQFNVLATFGKVGGLDKAWENAELPEGFNFEQSHELKVVKSGKEFKFYVDGKLLQTREFDISNGQIGLITEDTKASYKNVTVIKAEEEKAAQESSDENTSEGSAGDSTEASESNTLPDTASNTLNVLLMSVALLIIGGVLFFLNKRKERE